jgi:sugar/nucleoside kinase (ribokinase family)
MTRLSYRSHDVLVAGELNVDLILRGNVRPEFGQVENLVEDMTLTAGGSAAIFAASAAKMGLRVLYASVVGDDLFGEFMLEAMQDAGVDTSLVRVDPDVKTGATVHLSRGHDRAMLTYLGSIAAVRPEHVPSEAYEKARHLHVASPFLLSGLYPAMPTMMRRAKRAGLSISLDTNWDPTGRWALAGFFEHLDVFIPNEAELLAISGETALDAAIEIMATRVPVLVVKRAHAGALVVREGRERIEVPGFDVPAVDTTGAGDTFDGGFIAGWLRDEPLRECLLLGSACGALTVQQAGGFAGQPTWEQAKAFIQQRMTGANDAT